MNHNVLQSGGEEKDCHTYVDVKEKKPIEVTEISAGRHSCAIAGSVEGERTKKSVGIGSAIAVSWNGLA